MRVVLLRPGSVMALFEAGTWYGAKVGVRDDDAKVRIRCGEARQNWV